MQILLHKFFAIRFDNPKLCATSPASMLDLQCPLCLRAKSENYASLQQKISGVMCNWDYFSCSVCGLVFRSPEQYLLQEEEKQRYLLHNNHLQQEGYRRHLLQLWEPLKALLVVKDSGHLREPSNSLTEEIVECKNGGEEGFLESSEFLQELNLRLLNASSKEKILRGLDFGSGPEPALAQMISSEGFAIAKWDPFFCADEKVFASTYDFITCMEVIEHCHHPHRELGRMYKLMKPKGLLAIGTWLWKEDCDFIHWGYRQDPTHVIFLRPQTVDWICKEWEMKKVYNSQRVFILEK